MGYTAAEAHVHADELGGTFSDEMIERIDERLGHPERCPHGWPVDPDVEQAENRELEPLSDVPPGESATIVRLAEHDGELLHWFYDEGLVPGEVELRGAEPARSSSGRGRRRREGTGERAPRVLRRGASALPRSRRSATRGGGRGPAGPLPGKSSSRPSDGAALARSAGKVRSRRRRWLSRSAHHERLDHCLRNVLRAERLDKDRERLRDADRVRDLDLAAVGEPGGDDVLRDVARRVRR